MARVKEWRSTPVMLSLDLCERPAPVEPAHDLPVLREPASPFVQLQLRQVENKRRFLRRSTRRLVAMALIALGVRIFIGEASVVPTGSMEKTILIGDHLFLNKMLYGPEV
ncbi:MAG: S26 family signal peptidase, partial [Candidatus Angelobacter sp.]